MDSTTSSEREVAPFDQPRTGPVGGVESITGHDEETYLPEKIRERGIALSLSGGGFRAALFHLGAFRRLNELGVLSRIETISSVSGGSIISAHLAQRLRPWPRPGDILPVEDWEEIAQPFRAFTRRNLRTMPLLKRLWPPFNFIAHPAAAAEALMEQYRARITKMTLRDLPERPRFVFCASELSYGVNWVFSRDEVGDYQVGYVQPAPASAWPVARAVASSSCFPPPFDPIPVPSEFKDAHPKRGKARHDPDYEKNLSGLVLSDGGVYDNLGIEPVWKSHRIVLVSDGGATFDPQWDKGLIWRTARPLSVIGNQATSVRKRWLISSFIEHAMDPTNPYALRGTYWGIGSPVSRYRRKGEQPPLGYSETLVRRYIAEVRTDMDAFSRAEVEVLENHGYLLAEAAIRRHTPQLIDPKALPLKVPHPKWFEGSNIEEKVKKALADSGKVKLLGRW